MDIEFVRLLFSSKPNPERPNWQSVRLDVSDPPAATVLSKFTRAILLPNLNLLQLAAIAA